MAETAGTPTVRVTSADGGGGGAPSVAASTPKDPPSRAQSPFGDTSQYRSVADLPKPASTLPAVKSEPPSRAQSPFGDTSQYRRVADLPKPAAEPSPASD